jgi:hypothetical protein
VFYGFKLVRYDRIEGDAQAAPDAKESGGHVILVNDLAFDRSDTRAVRRELRRSISVGECGCADVCARACEIRR